MTQLAIYVDDETAARLDEAARRANVSRSAWVREAIHNHLRERLPESFFDVLGAWEDDREPNEIRRDIRSTGPEAPRASFD